MRYEEMLGSDRYLEQLVEVAVTLGQAGDEFMVIPPGVCCNRHTFCVFLTTNNSYSSSGKSIRIGIASMYIIPR
jgi:hypothetical protein